MLFKLTEFVYIAVANNRVKCGGGKRIFLCSCSKDFYSLYDMENKGRKKLYCDLQFDKERGVPIKVASFKVIETTPW